MPQAILQEIHDTAVEMFILRQTRDYLKSNKTVSRKEDLRSAKRSLRKTEKTVQNLITAFIDAHTTGNWRQKAREEDHLSEVRAVIADTLKKAEREALMENFNGIIEQSG